jgi:hypothetical protein
LNTSILNRLQTLASNGNRAKGLRWRNAGYAVLLVAAELIVWWVVYRDPAALTTKIYDLGDSLVVLQSAENHALILKFF